MAPTICYSSQAIVIVTFITTIVLNINAFSEFDRVIDRPNNKNQSIDLFSDVTKKTDSTWTNCPWCGVNKRNRIVGGRAASIKDFPWTVDIRMNGHQHCGGSIIRSRYVLTAAHCLVGHDISTFVVVASVTDILDTRAFHSKVDSGKHHPKFDPVTYDNDVAVLRLDRALPIGKGVRTICLRTAGDDDDATLDGQYAIVSGWGTMQERSGVAPTQLQKLGVPIVGNDECRKAKGLEDQLITDRMLCAGYLNGTKDACSGDSGGPLVWYNKGVWTQIGIVSWGIGCARANYYGVYTRVSAFTSWIARNTEGLHQC